MLKLHVFLVDTGFMYTFDMEMALESVSKLMEAISIMTQIPVNKQVLLIANGEPLNPSSRVGSYKSAGTETNPIFLFSKSAIESPQPPMSSSTIGSELSLEEQVEICLQMPPTIETLVSRAKLASEFHLSARELGEMCENLVGDQQLQQQGWQAVVSNLENITMALKTHAVVFQEHYNRFLSTQDQYLDMLNRYDGVISLLSRIPVLSCLVKNANSAESGNVVLLDWISSKEQKTSLQTLVSQCGELLNQFDGKVLQNLTDEVKKVLESSENKSMKEIKGLDERLVSLQQRLAIAQQFVQDQADMAQGFKQNQMRAEHLGDPSVLPDLCVSHRKQLLVLLKNHKQLRDICTLCTKAKDELSANLHARLRWVMYVEHSICNCDSKLLVFHESLKKMKRRLEVFEQVFEAPRMYVLAVLEILRRKSFSVQFLEWGRNVSISASEARSEEIEKRNKFSQVFGNHFLQSLFSGLDDSPSMFAELPPSIFDERLPDIDVNDVQILQREVPELLIELSLGDPLEQSFYVRERLSQTNLSKLVDPKSNPTLEETLRLRERTGINAMSKMTVSQLHKEISQEDMPIGMTRKPIDWQLGDTEEGMTERDFQPSSLKTLSSEMEGLQSSQSSEISDSLFRSAEGLDDKGEFCGDSQGEVVGVLELSECATPQPECNAKSVLIDSYETVALQKTEVLEVSRKRTSTDTTVTEDIAQGIRSLSDSPYVAIASPKLRQSAFVVVECVKNLRKEFCEISKAVSLFRNDFVEVIDDISKEITMKLSSFVSEFVAAVDRNRSLTEELEKQKTSTFDYVSQMTAEFENKKDELQKEYRNNLKTMEQDVGHRHEEEITLIQRAHEAEMNSLKSNLCGSQNRLEDKEVGLQNALAEIDRLEERYLMRDKEIENMITEWKMQEQELNETISRLKAEKANQDEFIQEITKALESLKMSKSQLDSDNQTNFNIALNKVKKEKEGIIKELQNEIEILKNELKLKDQKLKQTIGENLHYKDVNDTIMSRIETLEKDKEVIAENCEAQIAKERENCDRMILSIKNEMEKVKFEISENCRTEKLELQMKWKSELQEILDDATSSMKETAEKEKLELLENFKKEKLELEMKWQLEAQQNLDRTISSMKENTEEEKHELLENFRKEKLDLLEKSKSETRDKQKEFENHLTEMSEKFETEKYELLKNFEEVKSNLKADFGAEKFKLIEDCKKQKLLLKEDFEREKATLKEEFGKEKSEIVLTCELEKQKLTDELEKQQSLSKTSSIEEGIDALEWDKLLQKLRDLEAENKELQDESESKAKTPPLEDLESYKKLLLEKEEENATLKEKLGQLKILAGDSSKLEGQEKICFKQFKVNDLVLLCYDEQRSNYMVLTSEDTKYFLHPDSKSALKLNTDDASKTREWLLAYVAEQEYCIAKKVQNRFKLPVGTYFYRIHAKPWNS